jgi:hypothetical protein
MIKLVDGLWLGARVMRKINKKSKDPGFAIQTRATLHLVSSVLLLLLFCFALAGHYKCYGYYKI